MVVLREVKKHFILTGSRRMAEKYGKIISGNISSDTDWDFCGEYTIANIKFLKKLDFKSAFTFDEQDEYDQKGGRIREVYKHEKGIDVILHKDLELYLKCFESIGAYDYCKHYWKSSDMCKNSREEINEFFDEMFSFYELGLSPTNLDSLL